MSYSESRSADGEIKVKSEDLGRIIGRGGSNVKSMESRSDCKITIPRDRKDENGEEPYYTVIQLSGSDSACEHAKELIEDVCAEAAKYSNGGGGGGRRREGGGRDRRDSGDRYRGGSDRYSDRGGDRYGSSSRYGSSGGDRYGSSDRYGDRRGGGGGGGGGRDRECFNCKGVGHIAKFCPEERRERY
ncbi:uncharacterized protein LOC141907459 [Tubulanus polymorphus]|uniref:uncharacterized protein LOC141907459 n=1 Tax=Tubulanus polymorphus TaxID=672921 RepID=UPI003DA519BC